MEEDIRKQGVLYLQQQRFGKKWKRVWCVLYRESSCSISRLEFYECKDGGNAEKNDKTLRKQQEHKKVIRLADCIRVTEVEMEGCPKDTGSFLVETTEKIYVFAADRNHLDDWTHKLCEIAFPMSWTDTGVKRGSLQRGTRVEEDEGMEDNSLYSGRETVRDFRVSIRRTEASERCRLKGDGVLRADMDALHLLDKGGDIVYTWPYRYLRRFGRDKSTFSFEAGRRCDSGEGNFEFDTKQGNVLFQAVEAAINLQKVAPPHRQTSGGARRVQTPPRASACPPTAQPATGPEQDAASAPQPDAPSRSGEPTPQFLKRSELGYDSARFKRPAFSLQAADDVYSMVSEPPNLQMIHHIDKESCNASQQQQQRPQMCRLEPPVDKTLTGVKSLNLDSRLPAPRKNQVKMISSCPLPNASPDSSPNLSTGPAPGSVPNPRLSPKPSAKPEQTYSQITMSTERGTKREKRNANVAAPCTDSEADYSLPFDTIAKNVMTDILNSHRTDSGHAGADPLYDSIDEMKIRNVFTSDSDTVKTLDHIYDEPEGCAAAAKGQKSNPSTSVYDDPEEMRGDAWRIMGTAADPKGHEYPYNPRVDDYAVPKQAQRAFPVTQSSNEEAEEEVEEEEEEESEEPGLREELREQRQDSPYNNVMVKMA
ncbi:docking protein 2 [Oreochromis niloticus]|uniref:Docking protein 2 n=1 Tax=Oreochromis niloticus TaxID=8128 RepID=I3IW93_ORENI|nr:docking protein 2 [Oreochromis niloticus]